jgi:hypothetical protein
MARRNASGVASALGWGILLLLGAIMAIVNAVVQFIQENWLAVRAALITGGIALAVFLLFKMLKRRSSAKVASDRLGATIGAVQHVQLPSVPAGASLAASRAQSSGAAAKWIRASELVQVQDITLSYGLFYLGQAAPGSSIERCGQYVINPKLPIAKAGADIEGSSMPYWPSYANITPNARRALLQWMADGRRDPAYGIGHVFLFFYGLEHRLFMEGARGDATILIAEVRRLLSIYGGDNSFRHYASHFLFAAHIFGGLAIEPPRPTAVRDGSPEIAESVRLHIGKLLANTDMFSAEDALVWALAIPDVYLRTPAVRCFEEFEALWSIRFAQKYPNGLRARAPKQTLRLHYRAASGAFEVDLLRKDENYPDIAALRAPIDHLKALVQACTDELETYSRFIGRNPNQKASMQAALLLPIDLQVLDQTNAITRLGDRLGELFGTRVSMSMQMQKLLDLANFNLPAHERLPAAATDNLSQALDRIGFAIEPDRRYGGWTPHPNDEIVLFRADSGGPIDPARPAYGAVKTQVEVAVLAAAADGSPSGEEFEAIKRTIAAAEDLSPIERARLLACALTLFKSPPKQDRVMRRLSERTPAERRAIASAAVAMIGADGRIDASEVRFLEKLHKALGLPKENVYSELHRSAVVLDEPVVISTERRTPGIPIPKSKGPATTIDPSRLARVRKDTETVSKLLAQIFVDTSTSQDNAQKIAVDSTKFASPLEGLDVAHAELVESIEMRGEVPRNEFEERARALKLLPEGALETINDWSFDRFDEPLLEDGDQIIIAAHLRHRLAELRESTS